MAVLCVKYEMLAASPAWQIQWGRCALHHPGFSAGCKWEASAWSQKRYGDWGAQGSVSYARSRLEAAWRISVLPEPKCKGRQRSAFSAHI